MAAQGEGKLKMTTCEIVSHKKRSIPKVIKGVNQQLRGLTITFTLTVSTHLRVVETETAGLVKWYQDLHQKRLVLCLEWQSKTVDDAA